MAYFDVVIIGAGIVGLSTAHSILNQFPHLRLAIIEKENEVAKHQTGHNSGVIHSGIYYKPGSLKAKNCVEGVQKLRSFCDEHHIAYELCGKLIVATSKDELPKLHEIYKRGIANQVPKIRLIDSNELKEIEPFAHGIQAIYCPETGIIDYKEVSKVLASQIKKQGGSFYFQHKVLQIQKVTQSIRIICQEQDFEASYFINCAGLYADKIARLEDPSVREKIIPFRGEYFFLKPEKQKLLKGLIYPVPDPKFPFLGVHLTKRLNGQVEVGPNAVLALAREGYKKSIFNSRECFDHLFFSGFWAMAKKHWKAGCYELYRSFSKTAFLKDAQKLMPSLAKNDLISGGSGVRAQIVDPQGQLCDDFLIYSRNHCTHVLNAPSPAATSSFSIAKSIVHQIYSRLDQIKPKKTKVMYTDVLL